MPTTARDDDADDRELRAELHRHLSNGHVLTLACHDAQGCWASPVFYAHEGLDLYFLSSPRSRHILSLGFDHRCAGAIHAPARRWQEIVGLQLAGVVTPLEGAAAQHARQAYETRFPFVTEDGGPGHGLAAALRQAGCYRLRVDEAVLIDNTRGLGERRRWPRPR